MLLHHRRSPDTPSASLSGGGHDLADNVKNGLGSKWAAVATGSAESFSAKDASSGKAIASASATPPHAPEVFTLWLIGNQTAHGAPPPPCRHNCCTRVRGTGEAKTGQCD